jgi:hypothetical protein
MGTSLKVEERFTQARTRLDNSLSSSSSGINVLRYVHGTSGPYETCVDSEETYMGFRTLKLGTVSENDSQSVLEVRTICFKESITHGLGTRVSKYKTTPDISRGMERSW